MTTLLAICCLLHYIIVITHARRGPPIEESYYLIDERVAENLEFFMNQPKIALDVFSNYYNNRGFPNSMNARDYNIVMQFIYSLIIAYEG